MDDDDDNVELLLEWCSSVWAITPDLMKIATMPDETVGELIERYCDLWLQYDGIEGGDGVSLTDILSRATMHFGVAEFEAICAKQEREKIEDRLVMARTLILHLSSHAYTIGILDDAAYMRVRKAVQLMHAAYQMFRIMVSQADIVNDQIFMREINPDVYIQRMYGLGETDTNLRTSDFQELVTFLLREAMLERVGRSNDNVYKEIVYEGNRTYAWESIGSIVDWVNEKCSPDNIVGHQLACRSPGLLKSAREYILSSSTCVAMPMIERDRHVFSFRNGVYFAKSDTFVPYTEPILYPEGADKAGRQPIAARFHDVEFNEYPEYRGALASNIPTPSLSKILQDQDFAVQDIHATEVLLGRCIYDLHEEHTVLRENGEEEIVTESWDVALCLYGLRGTGKTKITQIVRMFYEAGDVGTIVNHMRKIQGLENLDTKFVVVSADLKGDCWLDRTLWQLMVDGDMVQIQGMFKSGRETKWRSPTVWAYNENPWPDDPQGSVGRRQALLRFTRRIDSSKVDTALDEKLRANIANILLKCNRLYLDAVHKYGGNQANPGVGFWDWCPRTFTEARAHMQTQVNPWAHYLNSERVVCDPKLYIELSQLQRSYKEYAKEVLDRVRVETREQAFLSAFTDLGLIVQTVEARLVYPHPDRGPMQRYIQPGVKIVRGIDVNI